MEYNGFLTILCCWVDQAKALDMQKQLIEFCFYNTNLKPIETCTAFRNERCRISQPFSVLCL